MSEEGFHSRSPCQREFCRRATIAARTFIQGRCLYKALILEQINVTAIQQARFCGFQWSSRNPCYCTIHYNTDHDNKSKSFRFYKSILLVELDTCKVLRYVTDSFDFWCHYNYSSSKHFLAFMANWIAKWTRMVKMYFQKRIKRRIHFIERENEMNR